MSNTVTFTHPAGPNEVIVTGDFDNWRQSLPLVKQADGSFNLTMPIPIKSIKDSNRLYFKYVVDGEWIVSDAYPTAPSVENASITNNYVEISEESKRASSFIPESALPINFASNNNSNNNVSKNKKRVKVKRRIRKNKKTGEETVLSEEKQVLDNTTSATEVSDNTRDNTPVVPAQKEEQEQEQEKPKFTTQPVEEEKTIKVGEIPSLAGEPNVAVPTKIEEVKEFTEIREVNQEELNAKLNSELENKEKVEEPTFTTQPVEQEESTKIGQIPSLAGEPGIVIPSNAQEIKEFTEVRDVNQEELNAELNSELKDKEHVPETAEEPAEEQAEEPAEEQAAETPAVAAATAAAAAAAAPAASATAPKKAVASTPSKKESSGCCIIC